VLQFALAAGSAVPLLFWGGLSGWPWDHGSAAKPVPLAAAAADPVRIQISSLKIDAPVDPLTVDQATSGLTPPGYGRAGWYAAGPEPGQVGRAVFEGHATNGSGGTDVFAGLSAAKAGEKIVVTTAGGKTVQFVVTSVQTYDTAAVPADQVFGSDGKTAQLTMIVPTGATAAGSYQQDLVVYANLLS
jgi:sortase (surface protein transpeptidase)